jgi:hypothetical protein
MGAPPNISLPPARPKGEKTGYHHEQHTHTKPIFGLEEFWRDITVTKLVNNKDNTTVEPNPMLGDTMLDLCCMRYACTNYA